MKMQHQAERKARVRMMIQAAGLLQKSGLLEVFHITSGDDLQAYENREKASALLGFLTECFEEKDFNEVNLEKWKTKGKRALRY